MMILESAKMYTQMSLFSSMPKPVITTKVYKHPDKARQRLYSVCWCGKCDKTVAMIWIEHGILKRCPVCGMEYEGWKMSARDNE